MHHADGRAFGIIWGRGLGCGWGSKRGWGGRIYSNGAVRVLREIFVAGRVKEVDLDVVVLELQRRGGDRDASLLQPTPAEPSTLAILL